MLLVYTSDIAIENQIPLYMAIEFDNFEIIKLLVDNGAEINAISINGKAPLHCAVEKGKLNIIQWLAEHGADINIESHPIRFSGHQSLSERIIQNNIAIIKKPIKNQDQIVPNEKIDSFDFIQWLSEHIPLIKNCRGQMPFCGGTPLHFAVHNNRFDIIKLLIEMGANINASDFYNTTPLHLAVGISSLENIQWLVQHGADINALTIYNETPLHIAIRNNRVDVTQWLVKHGAFVKDKEYYSHPNYPLFALYLSDHKHIETIKWFAKNADYINTIYEKDPNDKRTLLHIAVELDNMHVTRWLTENGADINAQANDNVTPLALAAKKGFCSIVTFLLDQKANVHIGDGLALRESCLNGHIEIAEKLISRGANLKAQNPVNCSLQQQQMAIYL